MWDLVWAAAPFALSMTGSPGPNNVLVAASATNFGVARTLPQIVGFTTGLGLMICAMGLGLGEVVRLFPWLHEGLKILGAVYLLYLAWRIARARAPGDSNGKGRPLSFVEGLLFQLTNPKAWIVALGAVTTYTVADADMLPQVLTLALVFMAVGTPACGAWALFGHGAARLLKRPRHLRLFNLAMAGLLVASVVPLFL